MNKYSLIDGTVDSSMTQNIYNNEYTNDIQVVKNNYYNTQKKNSVDPINKNIIAPYARNIISASNAKLKYSDTILNSNENDLKYQTNDSFDKQFDLASLNNQNKPISQNSLNPLTDSKWSNFSMNAQNDMTYGIVSKENFIFENMVPFTNKRDTIINDNNSYISQSLANFTGVGLKQQKVEMIEPFFTPEDSKKSGPLVYGDDDMRNRFTSYKGYKKTNERLFEPEYVGPGVGLDPSQQTLGGLHDDTRILPESTNQLRPVHKPKLSYTEPVKAPQLGHIISSTQNQGEVRKYRPDTFVEYGSDVFWSGKAHNTSQQTPQNYIMKDTSRAISKELIGPAIGSNNAMYNPTIAGAVGPTIKQQMKSLPVSSIGGITSKQNGQGKDNSYLNYENQRDTTNVEYINNVKNNSVKQVVASFNDNAKSTIRQFISQPFNTNIGTAVQAGAGYAPDNAKSTIRQDVNQPFNTNVGTSVQTVASYTTDNARGTLRQDANQPFNTNVGTSIQSVASYTNDLARGTIRQDVNQPFNTNVGSAIQTSANHYQDLARGTVRQDTNQPFNTNVGTAVQAGANHYFDLARGTVRQDTNQPFNTNVGTAVQASANHYQDLARGTVRQDTNQPFNTNIGTAVQVSANHYQDLAKSTVRQDTNQPFNTNIGTAVQASANHYQDNAKGTVRQFTNQPFNTNIGTAVQANANHYQDNAKITIRDGQQIDYQGPIQKPVEANAQYYQDIAKPTVKQSTLNENYLSIGGTTTLNQLMAQLSDLAKPTIKQTTLNENYIGTGKFGVSENRNRSDIQNMEVSDAREKLSKLPTPTPKGTFNTPNKHFVNMVLKDSATYDPLLVPNKARYGDPRSNFEFGAKKNNTQQGSFELDSSFIDIMGNVLTSNPLINNLIYRSNINAKGKDPTFVYNRS